MSETLTLLPGSHRTPGSRVYLVPKPTRSLPGERLHNSQSHLLLGDFSDLPLPSQAQTESGAESPSVLGMFS